jgi:hypothetical protein
MLHYERIFLPGPMRLRDDLFLLPLEERFVYDRKQNLFFIHHRRISTRHKPIWRSAGSHLPPIRETAARRPALALQVVRWRVALTIPHTATAVVRSRTSEAASAMHSKTPSSSR